MRHFPEEFTQTADLGHDHFARQSAAEVERAFVVHAGSPLAAASLAPDTRVPTGASFS